MNLRVLFCLLVCCFSSNLLLADTLNPNEVLAFPTAEGFGRHAKGGRGGDVYHVTNLTDSGSGSFRYGIESANGPRTIVFDVSGTISLEKKLNIRSSYMTIAGQTAPGGGITLRGKSFNIKADHVIVRYIRSRLGYVPIDKNNPTAQEQAEYLHDARVDAISVKSGSNIIIDHCSASWSVDETLSNQSDDVDLMTLQWSIISESLNNSVHEKGAHGYGGIIGAHRQSYHHNLFAHHNSRLPKITWRRHTKVDFRNNVIYNWGNNSSYDGTSSHTNWVGNYYKPGPATHKNIKSRIFQIYNNLDAPDLKSSDDLETNNKYETKFYIANNYVEGDRSVSADNWLGVDYKTGYSKDYKALVPFNYPEIKQYEPAIALNNKIDLFTIRKRFMNVLNSAGASHVRDSVDERVLTDVIQGTASNKVVNSEGKVVIGNGIIDSQEEVGGWPELDQSVSAPLDTDQDGMPDSWEDKNGLNKNDPTDRNLDKNGDGYTELEEYLNHIVS